LIGSLVIAIGCGVEGHPNLRIDPGPGCWSKPCKDITFITDETIVIDTIELDNEKNTAEGCQEYCKDNEDCKFFSFTHHPTTGDCKLLKEECVHETFDDANHISGPKDCEEIPSCPVLEPPTELGSPESMFWTDQSGTTNPYKQESGIGTKIITSCGDEKHISECKVDDKDDTKAKWSTEDGKFDPTKPDDEGSKCKCPEFKFWYDPNDEAGAIFSCSETNDFSSDFELAPTDECVLICGIEVYKHIYCHDGKWNDVEETEFEKGIGCFEFPAPKPNGSTTEEPDKTTTENSEDTTVGSTTEASEDTTTE